MIQEAVSPIAFGRRSLTVWKDQMESKVLSTILNIVFFVSSCTAIASERVTGMFQATRACDAYQSFKQATNPGSIEVSPGTQYDAVEVNKPEWEWIRIQVPGATESLRWVSKDCGTANVTFDANEPNSDLLCTVANRHDSFVLAVTWQPGFCEHHAYSGEKPECDAMETEELKINHFTLHGLWPNREQCGTNYGWCAGPELDLEQSTRLAMRPWMPNLIYEEDLASHEWEKHGTCQKLDDDNYFLIARKLVEVIDQSKVGSFIKSKIGLTISTENFFDHIKTQLGQSVAERIMLVCTGGRYLQELRINLPLNFEVDEGLSALVSGAARFQSPTQGCSGSAIYIEPSGSE